MSWLIPGLELGLPVTDILLEREAHAPDPGDGPEAQPLGWTAGMVRLRMGTVACLYKVTKDPRLEPVMEKLVNANLDPHRYPGMPLHKPHNKGALANAALLEAAIVFSKPHWREAAQERAENDIQATFDSCGMSREQSSAYHLLNTSVWRRVLAKTNSSDPDTLAMLAEAELAARQLTRPDGVLEAIGTGHPKIPRIAPTAHNPGPTHLYCTDSGWAANRDTWNADSTHYTLRFGPPPALHGHEDRGALTWFTQGVPVFSDRGVYDRTRGHRWDYAHSAQAHTTFTSPGQAWPRKFTADHVRTTNTDTYLVRTTGRDGASLTRNITFSLEGENAQHWLAVRDTGSSKQRRLWTQNWQLSEGWIPLTPATIRDPVALNPEAGLHLYGTCRSTRARELAPQRVETYPDWRQARYAYRLTCQDAGKDITLTTTWRVKDAGHALSSATNDKPRQRP